MRLVEVSVKRESTVDLLLLSRLIYEDRRVQFVRDQGGELPSPGLIISLGLRLGLFVLSLSRKVPA